MIRTQGARTSDPYSELQLRPHATRDLIIEAYWIIIARAQEQVTAPEEMRDRIFALNDAYALLMDERRRADYDAARGYDTIEPTVVKLQPIDPKVPAFEHAVIADGSDYYRLLAIERWADPRIIRAAHRSMLRVASGNTVRDFCLRDLLSNVYQTLSDPERRAEYDATLPRDRRSREAEKESTPELAPIESPHVEAANMIEEIAAPADVDIEPHDRLDDLRHAVDEPEPAEPERQRGLLGRLRGNGAQPAADEAPAPKPAPTPKPAPAPKPKRLNQQQRTIAAEQDRLLSLRDALLAADEEPPPAPPEPEPVPVAASPRLIIWSDGGRAVPIGDDTVSIGSGPGRDIMLTGNGVRSNHAQVWRHRDVLALRVPDGEDTFVNGTPMIMPLIYLEDGDEITIGEHRMTFRGFRDF